MRLSRKQRLWLSALVSVALPWVTEMSGIQGFLPVLTVCVGIILWSLWLFRDEIARLRIVSGTSGDVRTEKPLWLILPGIAMLVVAAYPFVNLYLAATRHIEPLTFNDLLQTYIHDRSIYVSDLARAESVIRNKVFENVTFVGPAIVMFLKNDSVHGSTFEAPGPMESVLLEVPAGTLTVGAIGFEDCVFRNCRFVRIQVMGTKPDIDRLREDLKKQGH
jgi:hypothetical protein